MERRTVSLTDVHMDKPTITKERRQPTLRKSMVEFRPADLGVRANLLRKTQRETSPSPNPPQSSCDLTKIFNLCILCKHSK